MAQKIITRRDARALNVNRYFTGKSCKNGHTAERTTQSGGCVLCAQDKYAKWMENTDPTFRRIKRRETNLRTRYGIELVEFIRLVDLQGGRCALCGTITKDLVVDHDHDTDKVRGLLCNSCNAMIGFSNDNTQILQLAIDYLVKHL